MSFRCFGGIMYLSVLCVIAYVTLRRVCHVSIANHNTNLKRTLFKGCLGFYLRGCGVLCQLM